MEARRIIQSLEPESRGAYPEDAFDTASLLSRAEEALDDAARTGPGAVALYGALAGADLGEPA